MSQKTYKDLPQKEEIKLTLWLSFLEEYINNALVQIRRWNRSKNAWDLHIFFVAMVCIFDATIELRKFWNYGPDYISEPELRKVFDNFRKNIEKYNLKEFRNNFIHRERIFKNKDRLGKTLSEYPVLILGSLTFNDGEFIYTFGTKEMKILGAFSLVKKFRKELKKIFNYKLALFYGGNSYESMVPFPCLRWFRDKKKNDISKYLKLFSKK